MSDRRVVRALIHGRVQGVGFRAWTQHQAEQRGLEGWARNRRDGSVEAVFAGPAQAVAGMVEACRQGPRGCAVESVDVREDAEAALAERRGTGGFAVLATV